MRKEEAEQARKEMRWLLMRLDTMLASEEALTEQEEPPEPEQTAWEKALEKATKEHFEAGILRLN